MSISNGIISAPISANDPYDLLGVPKQESGWVIGYICRNSHGRTNKWSRNKPVQKNEIGIVDFSTDITRKIGQIWGMKPPQMKQNDIFFNRMCYSIMSNKGEYFNWEYQPPRGGVNEPYRLTDFNNYNHKANAVFTTVLNSSNEVNIFNDVNIVFSFYLNQNTDFTISQFMDAFLEYRFIAEIYVENGDYWYNMSSPTHRYVSNKNLKEIQGWSDNIVIDVSSQLSSEYLIGKTIHCLMGIQNIQAGTPEGGTGIVAEWGTYFYPFYKPIKITNYFNRMFFPLAYNFDIINPQWYQVYDYNQITLIGTRPLIFKCSIEKKEKRVYILPEHPSSVPSSSYMKIKAVAYGTYTTEQYAIPVSSTFGILNYIIIDSSDKEGDFQEIYLMFNSILKIGQLHNLSFKATIDNGKTWVIMESVDMNVTCT